MLVAGASFLLVAVACFEAKSKKSARCVMEDN